MSLTLPRPPSADARKVIQKAYRDFVSIANVTDARRFRNTTIQDVREECRRIENELGSRGLLRNMHRLDPFLTGLEHYRKAVDVLCQGTPYLPWIWAPVVLILKIASDYIEAFEILIKSYARIGESLGRFELLGTVFVHNHGFQRILAVFYADILQFHQCAYKFVTLNGWRTFFLTTWGRFDRRFKSLLDDLKYHADLVDKEAMALNVANTQSLLDKLEADKLENLERVEREEKSETEKQFQAILTRLQIDDSDQSALWEGLLGNLDFEGTCSWVLKHDKVASWLRDKGDVRSLWLHGSAGSGKSVISAYLAKFRAGGERMVVRHFCNSLYDSSTKYETILKSIIRQLLQWSDNSTAYLHRALIAEKKILPTSALEIAVQQLVTIVSGSFQERGLVWIILDGLDACERRDLARLVGLMDAITSKETDSGLPACKVLFSSRSAPERKRTVVFLGNEKRHIQDSIRLYTTQRLQSSPLCDRLGQIGIGTSELVELGNDIARKADGMFLYAKLIIDFISVQLFRTGAEFKRAVNELPPELKGFYEKILSNILHRLDPISTQRIKCVLGWVAFAERPLKRLEFLSAITFSEGVEYPERLAPYFFLKDCSTLVEEKHDQTVGFIHVSVKEYLLDSGTINKELTRRQQALDTLTFLLSAAKFFLREESLDEKRLRVVRGVYSLLNYASKYWAEYVLSQAQAAGNYSKLDPEFHKMASSLAAYLSQHFPAPVSPELISKPLDKRLSLLDSNPLLRAQVAQSLRSLSQEGLEETVKQRRGDLEVPASDGISVILAKYLEIVQELSRRQYYPGVSREDFKIFLDVAQTSLFTCPLTSCPRASLGFRTEQELREHESNHLPKFWCSFAGCHYPLPFSTRQALADHSSKYHERKLHRKKLRHVRNFSPMYRGVQPRSTTQAEVMQVMPSQDIGRDRTSSPYVNQEKDNNPGCTAETPFPDFSPEIVLSVEGADSWTRHLCFSNDAKYIAVEIDRFIQIYDIGAKNMVDRFHTNEISPGDEFTARCICFSPDSKCLAFGGAGRLKVYDIEAKEVSCTLVCSVVFEEITIPKESVLASFSTGHQHSITFWDIKRRIRLKSFSSPARLFSIAVSLDVPNLVVAGSSREVIVFGEDSLDPTALFGFRRASSYGREIWSVDVSPGGSKFLGSGPDGAIMIWGRDGPADSMQRLGTLEGHKTAVITAKFTEDSERIISGSADAEVRVWDLKSGRSHVLVKEGMGKTIRPLLSRRGEYVAISRRRGIDIWSCRG